MNQTSPKVIIIVVVSIAILAAMGVATICTSFFMHAYADPAILTALISITSGLVGSLTTILSSPRSVPTTDGSTIHSTTTTSTTTNPPDPGIVANQPTPVTVVNQADAPVPVTESKP